jgi:hypothetical protein
MLLSSSLGLFMILLRDFGNVVPISYNEEWLAGNRGLSGLSGCHGSFFCWNFLFFPHCDLAIFKTFLNLFPRVSRHSSWTLPIADQLNSVPPTGSLELPKARRPCRYLLPLPLKRPRHPSSVDRGTSGPHSFICTYIYIIWKFLYIYIYENKSLNLYIYKYQKYIYIYICISKGEMLRWTKGIHLRTGPSPLEGDSLKTVYQP